MYTARYRHNFAAVERKADLPYEQTQLCVPGILSSDEDHHMPVLILRSDGPRVVILRCATKSDDASPDGFELTPDRVRWDRPLREIERICAFWRYEVIDSRRLGVKIGVMTEGAIVDLLAWARSRY